MWNGNEEWSPGRPFHIPIPHSAFVFLLGLLLSLPSVAWAQGAPQITVQADVDTVAVGDVLHLELSAQSGDAMPESPEPGATPGFVAGRPNTAPSQTHISINGTHIARYTLNVDWPLQAQRVGTFAVGPPSVVVAGTRYAGRSVTVRVVPAGQVPPRSPPQQAPQAQPRQPFGFSPFDPWRGLFPGVDPGSPIPDVAPSMPTDPKLALDAPRGTYYFLHATVDTATAVVGQQVLYNVYEYIDESAPANIEADSNDVHDPTAADFVKHSLLRDDQDAVLAGYASVGGHVWRVSLVRRWALFPLHGGDLTIGPMTISLIAPRGAAGTKRATETIHVRVTEPLAAGRPPGYALGDVGRFALAAQVSPRDVEQGGAVGVHVELSGTGNVPAAVTPPVREGVEWLAPEVHSQLGPIGRDTFGGRRTFDYVVRVLRPGDVDLGEMALPFWDPEQRRYDVARAALGTVRVKPSATGAAAASAAAEQELLPGLPPPRDALSGAATAASHLDDSPLFWMLGIGAWPAAFGVAVVGRGAGRRVAGAWRARKASPLSELKERVSAADAASSGQDARAADAATARALEAAAVALTGVSVRGAVGDEVADRLAEAGVDRGAAARVADLLRECEAARFSPDAADAPAARERWHRAQGAIRSLEKR
jgi:hypothetical protein